MDGPASGGPAATWIGSYGAISGASSPAVTSTVRSATPKRPSGSAVRRAKPLRSMLGPRVAWRPRAGDWAVPATVSSTPSGTTAASARVERCLADVRAGVDQNERADKQQHRCLDDQVVAAEDGIHHQPAQSRQAEDTFGDNGSA